MKLATIDIGTNTTLLLVAEATSAGQVRVLEDRAEITRLGRGIGRDGGLGAEGVARTLAALREYAELCRKHGAPLAVIGTEALRRAPNAAEFLGPAQEILGTPIEVIDGPREAALTFLAAATSFPEAAAGDMLVTDIGGGSTEIVFSQAGQVQLRESLPLGSVRLTERHLRSDPPTDAECAAAFQEIEAALDGIALPRPAAGAGITLVGTAGTVTTLAAMSLQLGTYDPNAVHGFRLTRERLEAEVERLRRAPLRERETFVGLDPRRADVILGGACVLLSLLRRLQEPEVLVNDRGIRWGLLYEQLAREGAPPPRGDGLPGRGGPG